MTWTAGGSASGPSTATGYADIWDWFSDALGGAVGDLTATDARFTRAAGAQVSALLASYPCVGASYAAVSTADRVLLDQATGLLLAASLRPVLLAAANDGQGVVVEEVTGPDRTKYAGPSAGGGSALETQWTTAANGILARIPCIAAGRRASAASSEIFGVGGRSRAREARTGSARPSYRELVRDAFGGRE